MQIFHYKSTLLVYITFEFISQVTHKLIPKSLYRYLMCRVRLILISHHSY